MAFSSLLRKSVLPLLLAALIGLIYAKLGPGRGPAAPTDFASTPRDLRDLLSLQQRARVAARTASAAVVAVENSESAAGLKKTKPGAVFQSYCSGVVISPDGLVLTQAHVSHMLSQEPDGTIKGLQPGSRSSVILAGGRRIEAELLGADQTLDLSLLRLLEPGPHPYAPLAPTTEVALGDWVLKLGHPIGFRRDRPAVVRLGRILFRNDDRFVTDCTIVGGDSGGPFFDLDGRLIGIVDRDRVPARLSGALNGPGRRGPFAAWSSRFIRDRLDALLRSEVAPFDQAAWDDYVPTFLDAADTLPPPHWTGGEATTRAFDTVVESTRPLVVTILDEDDRDVMLGTVVEPDGWVLTLASFLPKNPRCRLAPSRVLAAEVVGMDPAFDLALLKIPGTGLPTICWSDEPRFAAGTLLAAPGPGDSPPAIGAVSVARRDAPGPFPTRVTPPAPLAMIPNLSGEPSEKGFVVTLAVGEAADSGLRAGDVVLSIGVRAIRERDDLFKCVEGRRGEDRVPVRFLRRGQEMRSEILLRARALVDSKPFADTPTFFEHDMRLMLAQCGWPLVGLDGRVVGVSLYAGAYGCMAIPSDCIERLLPALKSGGVSGAAPRKIAPTKSAPRY